MPKTRRRDVEREYPKKLFIAKLRRLADALEHGRTFRIRVAGEDVRVPARATISIEHERGRTEEELEFQLKWTLTPPRASSRKR